GYGTVWEISSGGTFTTLHNFAETDGAYPYGRPFVTKSGDVYGTTYYGGSSGYGTLWEITGAGQKVHAKGHKH
ncbi:MAG TPA: choice-of-anchor tandem repeat GloVer-containing protein, partial [Chthoniobacterales bacterium]